MCPHTHWLITPQLWYFYNKLVTGRLTGQCELLLRLTGSSRPTPLSSSKLRLRLKAAVSRWAPPDRLLGSPRCTLLPCSLAARDSSWSAAWLSACRCSMTLNNTGQYMWSTSHLACWFLVCLNVTSTSDCSNNNNKSLWEQNWELFLK